MKIFKAFLYLLKDVNFWKFILKVFSHPKYTFGTILASFEAIHYAQIYFPYQHFNHSQGNAFRHAVWNSLIMYHCGKTQKKVEKKLLWTKEITTYFEEIFVNDELPRQMDEHNNQIGRLLYVKMLTTNPIINKQLLINELIKETKNIELVKSLEEIKKSNHLICLE